MQEYAADKQDIDICESMTLILQSTIYTVI